jgi:site-specific DNA-methyltransferase (adenine-specific)
LIYKSRTGATVTPYYDDGQIQIWCARCEDILSSIAAADVSLVLTDPPYGDSHDTDYTRFTGGVAASRSSHAAIEGDTAPFDPGPFLKVAQHVVLFGANRFSDRLPVGSLLVWDKRTPFGNKNVMSDGEVAWCSHGRGVYIFTHTWDGFNRASERQTRLHPSQKPVALMTWIIERYTQPGDLVLDPYMGSGPVARACKNTGRRYIGIEVVEAYCRVAVERLQQEVLI